MLRGIVVFCRQIKSSSRATQFYCGPWRKYHDVGQSFASNVEHPLEVLELIPREPTALTTNDIAGILNDLQRTYTQNPCEFSTIQEHPNFVVLAESIKMNLSTSQSSASSTLVKMLRTARKLGLPAKHDLTQSILRAVLHQVSTLTLEDIFALDNLVQKSYHARQPDALHEKLMLILPMVYQINYLDRIDYDNIDELCATLNFIANNFERTSRRAVAGVVTSLRMSSAEINQKHAIQIIKSLSKIKYINTHIEPLLKKCLQLVSVASLTPAEINTLLEYSYKINSDVVQFDEKFFENCVQRVMRDDCDVILACSIRRKLAKFKFSSVELLEFVCRKVTNDPLPLFETLGLIADLGNANHMPSNWNETILPMIEKMQLSKYVDEFEKVEWPRIAISLVQLGHYDSLLIERILRDDLKERFRRDFEESYQKLKELCRVKWFASLEKMLAKSLGADKVLPAVSTPHDSYIQCVLKINQQTGQFTSFAHGERSNENLSLDEIHCEPNELLIGIISTELPGRLRQKMMSLDLAMVPIDMRIWSDMPEYMKLTDVLNRITKHIQIYQDKRGEHQSK